MLRLTLAALATFGAVEADAQTIMLKCEEEQVGRAARPTQHMVVIETGPPASLSIRGPWGDIRLPASVESRDIPGQGKAIGVRASGPAATPMPVKADVDACLDERRKSQPDLFKQKAVKASFAQGCRIAAASTPGPVPVQMSVEVAILGSQVLSFFVERSYAGDDAEAARIYGVFSFPTWNCKVEGR